MQDIATERLLQEKKVNFILKFSPKLGLLKK